MCLPAVVPPEHEVRGLVGEHLAVGQGLQIKTMGVDSRQKCRQNFGMFLASPSPTHPPQPTTALFIYSRTNAGTAVCSRPSPHLLCTEGRHFSTDARPSPTVLLRCSPSALTITIDPDAVETALGRVGRGLQRHSRTERCSGSSQEISPICARPMQGISARRSMTQARVHTAVPSSHPHATLCALMLQ